MDWERLTAEEAELVRWQNEHGDDVYVEDALFSDADPTVDERYRVGYRPAASFGTTVPNGRFGDIDEAVAFAVEVVIGDASRYDDLDGFPRYEL